MPYNWNKIWLAAKEGRIEDIPAEIRIKYYIQIKQISTDYNNNNINNYMDSCYIG